MEILISPAVREGGKTKESGDLAQRYLEKEFRVSFGRRRPEGDHRAPAGPRPLARREGSAEESPLPEQRQAAGPQPGAGPVRAGGPGQERGTGGLAGRGGEGRARRAPARPRRSGPAVDGRALTSRVDTVLVKRSSPSSSSSKSAGRASPSGGGSLSAAIFPSSPAASPALT